MLILSRKKSEAVYIGDPKNPGAFIKLTVVEIRGDKVRLGVEAPKDIPVHRDEVFRAIHPEYFKHEDAAPETAPDQTQ